MLGSTFQPMHPGITIAFLLYNSQCITMLLMKVAGHDALIKTCHWINSSNYKCLMTGSWDKTVPYFIFYLFQVMHSNSCKTFYRSSFGIFVLSNRLWLSNYPSKFTALMWTALSQWCLQLVDKLSVISLRIIRHRWIRSLCRMCSNWSIAAFQSSRTQKEKLMDLL